MSTKAEVMAEALQGFGALGKAADDEPIFVLRAQDSLAADCIDQWAVWARAGDSPSDKIVGAKNIAEEFRQWPKQKHPD